MISGFIVKKLNSTRLFDDNGNMLSGTVCQASDLILSQIKTDKIDSYTSLQFAYGSKKHQTKPILSKLKKIKIKVIPKGFIEFSQTDETKLSPGDLVSFDQVFSVGDSVDARGKSKGRGFAGVIKRHGFHRQPVTRGASDRTRAPGSIGAQTPGKVVKGKKMPGHFGNITTTVKNLKILRFDKDKKQVIISGSLPGHKNSWLIIKKQHES